MCGISGFVVNGDSDYEVAGRQLSVLGHRGPDAAGQFGDGRGTIAQNRLAIIDLETGDPPITNEDGSVGVVLNGEIYNYWELRSRLVARGHTFSTKGDTEAIAHLAEDVDAPVLAGQLDGMFAFAVWDRHANRLTLGRDRWGKKPLYYWATRGVFVFASEIKAVLAHPDVPRELDEDALPAYLSFGYVPTARTFFRGIRSLPPGHVLTVEPGQQPVVSGYPRNPPAPAPLSPSFRTARREVRSRIESAVRKRLTSDVPLGAFLSGGLDSSAIVAVMAGMTDRPVQTFTIGFDDRDGFDERRFARLVAERYQTDHHEFVVAPNAVELIERLVWHHDQPFGDSSAVPTFLLNELTRSRVTVALSGDGGDEVFAGYERFAAALAIERYRHLPRRSRAAAASLIQALPRTALRGRVGSVQRFTRAADLGLPWAYLDWLSYFTEPTRKAAVPGGSDWAAEDFEQKWNATEGRPVLDRLLELNSATYLVDDLLVKADRMSMAHALEVRSPFLDSELVDYVTKLPAHFKLRGFDRKRILKAAVADLLPSQIIRRRKRGFGVPLDRWFREDLASYVTAMLGSPQARVRDHLVPAVIDRILAEHSSRAADHGQALWLLLTLEVFLRREGW